MADKSNFMAAFTGMAGDIKTLNNIYGVTIAGLPQNFNGKDLETLLADLDMFDAVWEQGIAEIDYNGSSQFKECINLHFKHAIASEAVLPSLTDTIDALLDAYGVDLYDRNYDFYAIHENHYPAVEKRCRLQYQGGAPSVDL